MITGINIFETRNYSLKRDTEGEKTIFEIGLLDNQIKSQILDKITDFAIGSDTPEDPAKISLRGNEKNLAIVKYGVRDIKNLMDPQTKKIVVVKFDVINKFGKSYNVLPDSVLNMLTLEDIIELAGQVMKETELPAEAEKN